MHTQKLIEQVAGSIKDGMTAEEAAEINKTTGFTFDHDQDGNSWQRTEGATLTEAQLQQAIDLANDPTFGWE